MGSKFEAELELLLVQVAMSAGKNMTSSLKNKGPRGALAIKLLLQKKILMSPV